MSSISTRPRVQKISGPIITTLAAAGAVLAAKAVKHLLAGAPEMRPEPSLETVPALKKAFIANRRKALAQIKPDVPEVEALRTATLASVASTPFYIDNSSALQAHCEALEAVATPVELQKAERALLNTLAASHQQVFINTLASACGRAAAHVGLDHVEIVRLSNQMRVIASDPSGRTLVSEIETDADGEPTMATEVVGVPDGSCGQLLDEFDRALEKEGVRSGPPERKFTGGVCELAAAREIARERWSPLTKPRIAFHPNNAAATARRQRLNKVAPRLPLKG